MIKIYTDGACKGNPGVGGWGAIIMQDEKNIELFGGENETTNNRMELMAVIMALKEISSNLERLYDYMNRRLLEASSANDTLMIDEVMKLLLEVKSGWDGIRAEYLTSTSKSVNKSANISESSLKSLTV